MKRLAWGALASLLILSALLGSAWISKYRLLALYLGISQPTHSGIVVKENVMVPMRDGVRLATDLFLPKGEGPFPVILVRLPYGKDGARSMDLGRFQFRPAIFFTQRGNVLITQDTRGRYASEGDFYAFRDEREDGEDMLRWLKEQPWFNGSVATFGGSYFGFTQWALAPNAGTTLKCMVPLVITSDIYASMFRGGAFSYLSTGGWAMGVGENKDGDLGKPKYEEGMWHLPLIDADEACVGDIDFYNDWLLHYKRDAYWDSINLCDDIQDIETPSLLITGWYDLFVGDQVRDFNRLLEEAGGQAKESRLIVGPWVHGGVEGDVEFGKDASLVSVLPDVMNWFDYWLRDKGSLAGKPVRIFVMGENRWREESSWPPEKMQIQPYYIHSQGNARSADGNGTLDTTPPGTEEPMDRFTYNPADPVPTTGGTFLGPNMGPRDQTEVEKREDVLVYTTKPLTEPVEVTGPIRFVLYASSSCEDTDFTAKLVDVHPDDLSINLQEGIIRARFRDPGKEEPLVPGEVYRYDIDLWSTSNLFLEGHRIRVQISSSNFPHFDRNLNIFGPYAHQTEMAVAKQIVYHDKERPSHILLPIVPR